MELLGFSLAMATEISLSFSTQTDNGTILLAVGGAGDGKVSYPLLRQIDLKLTVHTTQLHPWNIFWINNTVIWLSITARADFKVIVLTLH